MRGQVDGQLRLFPEDSPASRFPSPGSAEARKMTVISGLKCAELYRKSGPLGLLVKMCLGSSIWRSTRCYLIWKAKATPARRLLFQLRVSVPRTGGTGSPLWHTPQGQEPGIRPERLACKDGTFPKPGQRLYDKKTGRLVQVGLTQQAMMWSTPTARAGKGRSQTRTRQGAPDIQTAAAMFPTPTAQDAKNSTLPESQRNRASIPGYILSTMFPTPTTGAGLCGGTGNYQQLQKLKADGVITEMERRNMSQGNGGQLNPTWVEWLMGYPLGWTDLNASEMR